MQLFRISAGMAHKSEYLECFLIWYHLIQAKASPSRITTRKIPPKKAPTESEELELETGHGFGVVGSVVGGVGLVVEVVGVVGLGGILVELFVVVMGSAVDVVASVVVFVAFVVVEFVGASVVAFVVAVVVASIVAFAFGVVGAFAVPLLVVVSAADAKAKKKKVRRILLTGIVDG